MSLTVDITKKNITITGTTDTAVTIWSGLANIKHVYWYLAATAADLASILSLDGDIIMKMQAEANTSSQFYTLDQTYSGIVCDKLSSGTIIIYLR